MTLLSESAVLVLLTGMKEFDFLSKSVLCNGKVPFKKGGSEYLPGRRGAAGSAAATQHAGTRPSDLPGAGARGEGMHRVRGVRVRVKG